MAKKNIQSKAEADKLQQGAAVPDNSAPATDTIDPVNQAIADNPDVKAELEHLTHGEQIIRLRQKGLIGFEVQ